MCVSAPERDSSTNRAQSIEIAHKNASLLHCWGPLVRLPHPTLARVLLLRQCARRDFLENDCGAPGRGHIDFPAAFRALKSSGYDGRLTIEAFRRALPPLAVATRVWRDLFPTPTRSIAKDTRSFAAAGTQPERLVPRRRVKATIRAPHRGIVPNVAPRSS